MARTKGAKGRKNLPSNEQFKTEVKSLSMRLLRKIGIQIEEEDVDRGFLIRSAQLVCSMHHSIVVDEEKELEGQSPKSGVQPAPAKPDYTSPIVDFSNKKAERDQKLATK
jgi:hypothetical protein